MNADDAAEIDAACDRFEAEWKAGKRPRIKAHLAQASAKLRRELLRQLLRIEIAYRRQQGEHPRFADYQDLLPLLDAGLFRSVVDQTSNPSSVAGSPAPASQTPTGPFEGDPAA